MRYADREAILQIVRENPGISTPEVARMAYPGISEGDRADARCRVYHQLQELKRHGRIIRTGTVPGTKATSTWEAAE